MKLILSPAARGDILNQVRFLLEEFAYGAAALRIYYLQPDRHTIRVVRILHGKRDVGRILEGEGE